MPKSKDIEKKSIVVGLSGGVDSAIALFLLKERGWDPIGVSLRLPVLKSDTASRICKKLNIPYYIIDAKKEFKARVVDYFIKELKKNRTPNPCIVCNARVKFKKLFEFAKKHKIRYVATGHYARLRKSENLNHSQCLLTTAKDKERDQTYSLCLLPQKWLGHIIFPLGSYTKKEVYQIAQRNGFGFLLRRKSSQDFCFASGKYLTRFLEKEIGEIPGPIKDAQGNILGEHRGLYFYTIGQRKGVNIPAERPYFVLDKKPKENCLIVTKNQKDLLKKELLVKNINWVSGKISEFPLRAKVKIRYRHNPSPAFIYRVKQNTYRVQFDKPQRAITPGQFAVFYKRGVCLGGGEII